MICSRESKFYFIKIVGLLLRVGWLLWVGWLLGVVGVVGGQGLGLGLFGLLVGNGGVRLRWGGLIMYYIVF